MPPRPSVLRRGRALLLTTACIAAAVGFAACGDDDDDDDAAADEAAISAAIKAINDVNTTNDAGPALAVITDQGIERIFFTTRAEVEEDPSLLAGDPFVADEIEVDGDEATATGILDDGSDNALNSRLKVLFIKDGDTWKVNDSGAADGEIPDDAETVEMVLKEFEFDVDTDKFSDGKPIVIDAKNEGDQAHHVVLFKVESEAPLDELLASDEGEGLVFLGSSNSYAPDEEAKIGMATPLTPGRYAFACFLPDTDDPEGAPHSAKGMAKEFTVD